MFKAGLNDGHTHIATYTYVTNIGTRSSHMLYI